MDENGGLDNRGYCWIFKNILLSTDRSYSLWPTMIKECFTLNKIIGNNTLNINLLICKSSYLRLTRLSFRNDVKQSAVLSYCRRQKMSTDSQLFSLLLGWKLDSIAKTTSNIVQTCLIFSKSNAFQTTNMLQELKMEYSDPLWEK